MKKLKYKLINGRLYFSAGYRNKPSDWGRNYSDLISARIRELKQLYPRRDVTHERPGGYNDTAYFYISIGDKTW